MLIPRRVKHRKQHHPGRSGHATGGTKVSFGEFGIQALTPAYVTNRQIESARIAMTRHIKRGGKVWINIYPDRPLTKKPAETRMGSGKGSPEWWVANVKPGRLRGARSRGHDPCHPQAAPQGTHHQARGGRRIMAVGTKELSPVELDTFEDERLVDELKKAKEELFNLRFQSATGQLESHGRLKAVKRDIARIYTVIRERELGIRATPAPVEAPAKAEKKTKKAKAATDASEAAETKEA
jgi:large subunit ribosomal protein L16